MGLWKRVQKLLPVTLFVAGAITLLSTRQTETPSLEQRLGETQQQYDVRIAQRKRRLGQWALYGAGLSLVALGAAHAVLRAKGKKKSVLQPAVEHPLISALAVGVSYSIGAMPLVYSSENKSLVWLGGMMTGALTGASLMPLRRINPPYAINFPKKLYHLAQYWFSKPERRQVVLENMRQYWTAKWDVDFDLADCLLAQGKVDEGCTVLKRAMQDMPMMQPQMIFERYFTNPLTQEVLRQRRSEPRIFEMLALQIRQGDAIGALESLDRLIADTKDASRFAACAYVAQTLAEIGQAHVPAVKFTPEQIALLEKRAHKAWRDAITVILNDADREKRFKRLGESRNEVLEYAPNEFLKGLLVFKRCDEQDGARLQRERENILASRVRFKNHVVQSLAYAAHEGKAYHVLRHGTSRTLEQTLLARNAQESIDALKHATAALALLHRNVLGPGANDASGDGYYTNRLQTVFANQLAARVELTSELRNELDKAGYRVHHELADAPRGWYKDANPRNWLVEETGKVVAIDFEHRSLLPVQLDLVSLFEFSKASLNDSEREMMLEHYLRVLARKKPVDRKRFVDQYDAAALQRHLELAGYRARDKEDVAVSWHLSRARRYAVKLGEYGLDDALKKLKLEA